MNKLKIWFKNSWLDLFIVLGPLLLVLVMAFGWVFKNLDPAPPNHLTISTGDDESDLAEIAGQYRELLKKEGVDLILKSSKGPFENLQRLEDEDADVDAAFVPDGLGSPVEYPDVESLGSLYYEPIWIFYRSKDNLNHPSQLTGKKIAVGRVGHGTQVLAQRLMKLTGVDLATTQLLNIDSEGALAALKKNQVDAAIFMMGADEPIIHELALQKDLRLMDLDQAEAISRMDPAFHHLLLPRGALNLKADIPHQDMDLVASTTTLLVRDDLHPALSYLLLKAAKEIHSSPGIFEQRGEFPINKDDAFPLSDGATQFYKSGGPFWQRFLPYWLAAWVDRFLFLVIPFLALILPLLRLVPAIYNWRLRSRIYQRYGELKFLETQIHPAGSPADLDKFLSQLDQIEERVDKMKMPQNFSDFIYSLKGHIQFVRDRLEKIRVARLKTE